MPVVDVRRVLTRSECTATIVGSLVRWFAHLVPLATYNPSANDTPTRLPFGTAITFNS